MKQPIEYEAEDECPTMDFKQGKPMGKCWGDGHYRCKGCVFYRADFKRHGQPLIDFAHTIQVFQLNILK